MLGDDLTPFFAANEFAVTATWTPVIGTGASALVIFDKPDADILGGGVQSREYQIVYPATTFVGATAGDTVTIAAVAYKISGYPDQLEDGALMRARLYKP